MRALSESKQVAIPKDSLIGRLIEAPVRAGTLVWLGSRPARKEPMSILSEAKLVAQRGIEGDRYKTTTNGKRQVTLIATEDLAAIASFLDREKIAPELLRRNLVTKGINLMSLKDQRFKIGDAVLEGSGDCAPCSRMEEDFGVGGYNAVRGRGGITARIIVGGLIKIGDIVQRSYD